MDMRFTPENHTFLICAYGESPYLEECIESLLRQTVRSSIIISTSTPCRHITQMAEKYGFKLFVNKGNQSIADDWNYGYQQAETALVTIAHQDDIYKPAFLEEVLKALNEAEKPLITFTDYGELRGQDIVYSNTLLKVKQVLLFPFRFKALQKSKFIRRRSLSLGSGICCPSVTYVKQNLPDIIFQAGYRGAIDWQAWERLSKLSGEFVYCHKPLMLHRIHEDSETTRIIADKQRSGEDYEMFRKFWPRWTAKILACFYNKGEGSNSLD